MKNVDWGKVFVIFLCLVAVSLAIFALVNTIEEKYLLTTNNTSTQYEQCVLSTYVVPVAQGDGKIILETRYMYGMEKIKYTFDEYAVKRRFTGLGVERETTGREVLIYCH